MRFHCQFLLAGEYSFRYEIHSLTKDICHKNASVVARMFEQLNYWPQHMLVIGGKSSPFPSHLPTDSVHSVRVEEQRGGPNFCPEGDLNKPPLD